MRRKDCNEPEMAAKEIDPKVRRKIVAWMIIGELFVGLGIALWGRLAGDWRYMVIGLLVAGQAILIAVLLGKSRGAQDPEFARKLEETRARARENRKRDARRRLVSIGVAMAVVLGALMVRRYLPAFTSLPKSDQRVYLLLGAITLIVLGNFAWTAWKKKRASAQT
jgi:MFS family permease